MQLDFPEHAEFKGTKVLRQRNGLAFAYETSHTRVDADGAPNSYHPDDIGKKTPPFKGLDNPANAGYGTKKKSWWRDVLVPDPVEKQKAYVQPSGGFKGFFVSQTALREAGGSYLKPATFVDSTSFPYVVIPQTFTKENGFGFWIPGDVGLATFLPTGVSTPFIVGDAGGGKDAKLGEGSIALYVALGSQNVNARNGEGVLKGRYQYIVFPRSAPPKAERWPRTNAAIARQVRELIANTPGISQ